MSLYGLQQLIDSTRVVRKNTIQIAEDIPEKDYGYRPTPESRSVAETLTHIAFVAQISRRLHGSERVFSLTEEIIGEIIKQSEAYEKLPRSKDELLTLLREGGEEKCEWLATLPETVLTEQVQLPDGGSKSRFEILIGSKEHEMHHRAQLTVIERLLGIVPHLTQQRQPVREKAAA
ncbi:MAG TPA: DinB family protein [Pyrinomonadaceae bacterium]|jgi:uncharacterized damage-inducible protein DinB